MSKEHAYIMAREVKDLIKDIEAEGDTTESISFESVIKTIEDDDPNACELMAELPALVPLLKHVHKHAFWRGADFGRTTFLKLADDDEEYIE